PLRRGRARGRRGRGWGRRRSGRARRRAGAGRRRGAGARRERVSMLRGGVDLGGTKIQTVVVDERGEVRGERRRPTPTEGGPADVAAAIAGAMGEAAAAAGVKTGELAAI